MNELFQNIPKITTTVDKIIIIYLFVYPISMENISNIGNGVIN